MSGSVPGTPKPPFAPPRRRSSLEFSKVMESPNSQVESNTVQIVTPEIDEQTPILRSNIGKKRSTGTSFVTSGLPPGHVTQLQKVFQAAKANLHLDMHFAASPAGSIDSRLPLSEHRESYHTPQAGDLSPADQNWRYSTVPQLLAATSLDVREPFPDTSPELPAVVLGGFDADTQPVEPASSGFISPADDYDTEGNLRSRLPILPASSRSACHDTRKRTPIRSQSSTSQEQDGDDLAHPMTALKVDNNQASLDEDEMELSPTIEHLRRVSGGGCSLDSNLGVIPDGIFLSQTAKAAAEFAKAKRGLLKQAPHINHSDRRDVGLSSHCPDPMIHRISTHCPDPVLHQYSSSTPCPDPYAHNQLRTSKRALTSVDGPPVLGHWSNELRALGPTKVPRPHTVSRATALGSPISFPMRAPAPHRAISKSGNTNLRYSPLEPAQSVSGHQGRPPTLHDPDPHDEYPRQKWSYSQDSCGPRSSPVSGLYTFSTAAAKAAGQSAAPDLRIRNSYRTDTLTPFVLPLGNHKGNGTVDAPHPSTFGDNNGRLAEPRRPTGRRTPFHQEMRFAPQNRFRDLQFHSSPPRSGDRYVPSQVIRKRGNEDLGTLDFGIAEDETAEAPCSMMRPKLSGEVMQIDEDTRAAVRMSLYGSRTPECLQGAREGIRELSPNVDIWRKDVSRFLRYKKKRRSSYWDDDLKEVQMSPAGRRGIASSPIVSNRSMVAELDTTTSKAGSITFDENDLVGEVEQARTNFEQRMREELQETGLGDAAELEA